MLLYVIYFCFVRTTLRNCGICKHNSVRLFICMSVTLGICIWTWYCSYALPVYVSVTMWWNSDVVTFNTLTTRRV